MRVQNVVLAEGEPWQHFPDHFPGSHSSCCFSWHWFRHFKLWVDDWMNFISSSTSSSSFFSPFFVDALMNINVLRLLPEEFIQPHGSQMSNFISAYQEAGLLYQIYFEFQGFGLNYTFSFSWQSSLSMTKQICWYIMLSANTKSD